MRRLLDVCGLVVAAAAALVASVSLLFLCDARALFARFPRVPVFVRWASLVGAIANRFAMMLVSPIKPLRGRILSN